MPPPKIIIRPYVPSPTARIFHKSNKLVRGVKGPVGSGKSVMGVMELFSRALEQKPNAAVSGVPGSLLSETRTLSLRPRRLKP